ncbi:MAG: PilZ domain-containing protein [Treponema sp.]|jgi:hypothetical protein|nr:PilZ domain-containing protein [Treponema sp.]
MFNERKSIRYPAHSRARIPSAFTGEAFLKDISITGCCIECTINIDIKVNASYKIEILPETPAGIGRFEVTAESRWVRTGGYSCEVGFRILASPKGRLFQRYVDYLSWRSNTTSASAGTPSSS